MARTPDQRIRRVFLRLLPERSAESLEVRSDARRGPEPIFKVAFTLDGMRRGLRVAWAGEGWPRDVERTLALAPALDVVTAHRLSPGAIALLSRREVGYADETGRAEIVGSGLLISRDSLLAPADAAVPAVRWSTSVLSVTEALLADVRPTVDAMRDATGYSTGAMVNALNDLEAKGLLARPEAVRGPRSARRVVDIRRLLDVYAAAAGVHRAGLPVLRLARLWRDPLAALSEEIGPALDRRGIGWAATGAAAAALVAPYLTDFRVVELYVTEDHFSSVDVLNQALDTRGAERGHRVEVRPFPTPTATATSRVGPVEVVPTPRLYADLRALSGRFAEAAEHLREVTHLGGAAA